MICYTNLIFPFLKKVMTKAQKYYTENYYDRSKDSHLLLPSYHQLTEYNYSLAKMEVLAFIWKQYSAYSYLTFVLFKLNFWERIWNKKKYCDHIRQNDLKSTFKSQFHAGRGYSLLLIRVNIKDSIECNFIREFVSSILWWKNILNKWTSEIDNGVRKYQQNCLSMNIYISGSLVVVCKELCNEISTLWTVNMANYLFINENIVWENEWCWQRIIYVDFDAH